MMTVSAVMPTAADAATPPTAVLMVTPNSGPAPLTVLADGSRSVGGTYGLAKYTYRFGDGSSAVSGSHLTSASHTYTTAGTYSVTLSVVGTHGGTGDTGSTTQTVSVTAGSSYPHLGGLMDRGNCTAAADPYTPGYSFCQPLTTATAGYLAAFTLKVNWSDLVSYPNGNIDAPSYRFTVITDALRYAADHHVRMRLRVTGGHFAPDLVKSTVGSFVFHDSNTPTGDYATPKIWTAAYQKYWQNLQTALAAQFNGNPQLAEVEVCGWSLVSCEGMLLQGNKTLLTGATNARQLLDNGYSNQAHVAVIVADLAFMSSTWTRTRLNLTVQPMHFLTTTGTPTDTGTPFLTSGGGVSQAFIDGNAYHYLNHNFGVDATITGLHTLAADRSIFFHTGLGPKEISGDYSAGTCALGGSGTDTQTVNEYTYIALTKHYPFALQTETAGALGDPRCALSWPAAHSVMSIELPVGYPDYDSAYPNFLEPTNVRLQANAAAQN
jgi:PKD repeat protein